MISMLASLMNCKAENRCGYGIISAYFADQFFEKKYHPENASFLNNLFSSNQGVYDNDLFKILYWKSSFSDFILTIKNNKILLYAEYQYGINENVKSDNTWTNLNLPSLYRLYLFLFQGLFNNYKTLSGKAFEALFNKAVLDDLKEKEQETIIGKKIRLACVPAKRSGDHVLNFINLINSYKYIFEKLLRSILSAVEKSVFNHKKAI